MSGIAGDMRMLHLAATDKPDSRLAIELFCYSVRKQIAAMAAALGGIDMLVFTGGIGENDAVIRRSICRDLRWAGAFLVRVIGSQEDEQIARESDLVLTGAGR